MKNVLNYKGYFTKIEYSAEDHILYGKIEGINDLVNFESDSVEKIEKEFYAAVDDYLELCQELGQNPDKAYSGTFNVRIDPNLHRTIALNAIKNGESLNSIVEKALQAYMDESTNKKVEEIWRAVSTFSCGFKNVGSASSDLYPLSLNSYKNAKVISYA